MCLIAYSPKGTMIDRSVLAYAYNKNSDGIGIMSVAGIEKFMGKKALKRARRYLETYLVPEEIPFAIHFRWATHGAICMANTHPYEAPTGQHWIMHNGILGVTSNEATAAESDTAVYVRKFLGDMPGFDDTEFYKTVENHIGWGNKFCIMDGNGEFKLLNAGAGEWIDGQWFSNTYSLPTHKIPSRNWNTGTGWDGHTTMYSRSSATRVPKEVWDAQLRCLVPNPAYKAADDIDDDGATTVLHLPAPATPPGAVERTVDERWDGEDRRAYYEALEAGLTHGVDDYYDQGSATRAGEAAAAASIADTQKLPILTEKDLQEIGGDFRAEEDEEDQSRFRTYLRKVAAGIYAG